jgi:hypothetical protein
MYFEKQKIMQILLELLQKQKNDTPQKNLRKIWRNADLENLKIDPKFGYQCEVVSFQDDDTNG